MVGHRALFLTLDEPLIKLCKASAEQELDKMLQLLKLTYLKVLVLDEMGYLSMNREEASLFIRLATRRYKHTSRIIISKKGFVDWCQVLGDLVTVILHRLIHHVTTTKGKVNCLLKEKRKTGLLGVRCRPANPLKTTRRKLSDQKMLTTEPTNQ